jgi:hypothetical protein
MKDQSNNPGANYTAINKKRFEDFVIQMIRLKMIL